MKYNPIQIKNGRCCSVYEKSQREVNNNMKGGIIEGDIDLARNSSSPFPSRLNHNNKLKIISEEH